MIGHFAYEEQDYWYLLMYVLSEGHLNSDAGVEEE